MNNNNMSSTPLSMQYNYNGNSGFSSMVPQQVNRHGVSATQNSIIDDSNIYNQRHAHASPINFFDDTQSHNSPSVSIIDDNIFDDTFVQSTINVQQYIRLLPGGQGNQFLAPSIVHVWSNNFVPQGAQRPSNPSTSSYNLNPPPSHIGPGFSTAVKSDQYMQSGIIPARPRNRRRGNNCIFTSTSRVLRDRRNRPRDEVFSSL
ncbi:uncharacterized protein LOC131650134 [Vicia villosa]|uniref:uncharacterized protein LOC131650134 n=1 Tax=Vicia villosa TaxID=3911 RepID=UPI00273CE732|nr:uncharacterized protein LOC131650134 [Vicia villosa]